MNNTGAAFFMQARFFSNSAISLKAGCSIVKPIHHRVKIVKSALSERYRERSLPKNDIRNPNFKPTTTHQDRVQEFYENSIQPDMLLINYSHEYKGEEGNLKRRWDFTSPYHINRPLKDPAGKKLIPKRHERTNKNIPQLESIFVNSYVPECKESPYLHIPVALQIAQLTNKKGKIITAKENVVAWKLREGMKMGAKVELKGREMNQFLSTLTELVLPQIREFQGIPTDKGDGTGNVSIGLEPEHIKYFPEVDVFQDLFPKTFGMSITFHTNAQTDVEARTLLSAYGLPFIGNEKRA